jgi:glutamate-ammonia-ligase adenylyltransferase
MAAPEGTRRLLSVFSLSGHLTDVLVQNPEIFEVVSDPLIARQIATEDQVFEEGSRLVSASISYSHRLDRLRFLKQKHLLRLAAWEISGEGTPQTVCHGLSDLAAGIVRLAADIVWEQYKSARSWEGQNQITIAALGKLGGCELNYSSDIDLIFFLEDSADDEGERHAVRYCELLRSALADRMGRGALYRVDLRLRPFGSQGPIAPRWKSLNSYYEKYAEPWEQMALIRSKVIGASPENEAQWEDLRDNVAFKGVRGDWVVDHLVSMKEKGEELGGPDDLKRGPGGIREIEFLAQINQFLEGYREPGIRPKETLKALEQLKRHGVLPTLVAEEMMQAYSFLRRLEHLCQIDADRQVYAIPPEPAAATAIARALGMPDEAALRGSVAGIRQRVRTAYETFIPGQSRRKLIKTAGHEGLGKWIESLPDPEAYSASLLENRDSLNRMIEILDKAPAVASELQDAKGSDGVVSGEIMEPLDWAQRWRKQGSKGAPVWASLWRRDRSSVLARWVLGVGDGGKELADQYDGLLSGLTLDLPLTVIALGSWGAREMSPPSDGDGVIFIDPGTESDEGEERVREIVAEIRSARLRGAAVNLDLRLRPEGASGRVSVTKGQFLNYESHRMQTWERFAMGRSRLVYGSQEIFDMVRQSWAGQPLDDSGLAELLAMKKRIENERVSPSARNRHVKLGNGGLDDVTWLVQLWLMRHPFAAEGVGTGTRERIAALVNSELLGQAEGDLLLRAHDFLFRLRFWIAANGFDHDLLPENPDKLSRLALGLGLSSPNHVLSEYQDLTSGVRSLFLEGVARMQA